LLEAIRSVILCILLQLFIISLVKLACNLQDWRCVKHVTS